MRRCLFRRSMSIATLAFSMDLPLQNVRELLHERLEADRETVHITREVVVRHHRRYRCQQSHRSRNEGFGDAGSNVTESRLGDVREAPESIHDAPDSAEEADVG